MDKLLSSRKSDCWPSLHSPTNRQAGGQAGREKEKEKFETELSNRLRNPGANHLIVTSSERIGAVRSSV